MDLLAHPISECRIDGLVALHSRPASKSATHDDRLEVMAVSLDIDMLALEIVQNVLSDLLWSYHGGIPERLAEASAQGRSL